MKFMAKIWNRITSFGDKSAWLLIAVGATTLGLSDAPMLAMLVKWSSFAFIVAGIAIFLSRIAFASVNFRELLPLVLAGNDAASRLMSAVIIYCAIVFGAIVYWAK
jgi:hypothetical protein